MAIQFRDRPLRNGERSHWYCTKCGKELDVDFLYEHKCKIHHRRKRCASRNHTKELQSGFRMVR
jgi:hypothetical protein